MAKSNFFHIAIDGPVAAGKGTVSRLVAEELGFLYIDTGAMYRMAAFLCLQNGVDYFDEKQAVKLIKQSTMKLKKPADDKKDGRAITAILNGEDVSWKIRTEEVGNGASKISTLPKVRKLLVDLQKKIAAQENVIMEGRDITHNVLPNADLKIYMTANDIIRAKRRHFQLLTKGEDISFADVHNMLSERDNREMSRKINPLKIVDDAWVIDTSDLSITQVVSLVVSRVRVLMSQKKN